MKLNEIRFSPYKCVMFAGVRGWDKIKAFVLEGWVWGVMGNVTLHSGPETGDTETSSTLEMATVCLLI